MPGGRSDATQMGSRPGEAGLFTPQSNEGVAGRSDEDSSFFTKSVRESRLRRSFFHCLKCESAAENTSLLLGKIQDETAYFHLPKHFHVSWKKWAVMRNK